MNVEQIMTHAPVCIDMQAHAHEALVLADERSVHYLVVVDRDNDLAGITCLCDVMRVGVNDVVGEFAHAPVIYVMQGESVERAASIMKQCAVGCLPVLREHGNVVGVLTRHDLQVAGALTTRAHCVCCGSNHGLVDHGQGVSFCRACLESTPPPGTVARRWYCTLGSGD